MSTNLALFARVRALLESEAVSHSVTVHEAGSTAEAIAAARGTPLEMGVKALLMKTRKEWVVIAIRAHQRTDNRKVRHALGAQKLRFANRDELGGFGLVPGQVPPFGKPILPFRLVADQGITSLADLAFTAGTNTDSIVMPTADWQRLAKPEFFDLV